MFQNGGHWIGIYRTQCNTIKVEVERITRMNSMYAHCKQKRKQGKTEILILYISNYLNTTYSAVCTKAVNVYLLLHFMGDGT